MSLAAKKRRSPSAADQPTPIEIGHWDSRFDGLETGWGAYFQSASTPIPDGVDIDAWVDQYTTAWTARTCGVPRNEQEEITIDGRPGRIAVCGHTEATVVAGRRLYLFVGTDDGEFSNAWLDTIKLTPETAAVP